MGLGMCFDMKSWTCTCVQTCTLSRDNPWVNVPCTCMSTHMSIQMPMRMSTHMPMHTFTHMSTHMSIHRHHGVSLRLPQSPHREHRCPKVLLYSYGVYSYGLSSYGLYDCSLYNYGIDVPMYSGALTHARSQARSDDCTYLSTPARPQARACMDAQARAHSRGYGHK